MADSSVTLVGGLTRDPEIRFLNTGKAVVSAGLAVSRRFQVNGEWQEETSFFNLTVWDQLGENFAASCFKGNRVIVTGRLEQRSYETKDGEKRTSVDVIADAIGPDLRWATAEVSRTARTGGDDDRPAKAPKGKPKAAPAADPYGDEEPFS